MKRKQQKVPTYLTTEELARFFSVIKSPRDTAIFRLMYHRGLRASEPGLLQLADYQERAKRIGVHRLKGSNSYDYPTVAIEDKALRVWINKRGRHPGLLFESRNHQPISRWRIGQLMRQYCEAANIPPQKAHPHALKHSCGTQLSARDADIMGIKDHMGHRSLNSTLIYVQTTNVARESFARRQNNWT